MIYALFLPLSLLCVLVACGSHNFSSVGDPDRRLLVDTKFGPVVGTYYPPAYTRIPLSEVPYSTRLTFPRAFLGIPFAEPPINDLRFADTSPWRKSWRDAYGVPLYRATRYGNQCSQVFALPYRDVSEDCLFLNVFTPPFERMELYRRQGKLMPVMFWIFGGAFSFGNAGVGGVNDPVIYSGSFVCNNKDVIIVTFNHRLSALGFLTTDELRGNFAIQDQKEALKWTFENIASFGGDRDDITAFGMSSGSYTGLMLALDPSLPPIKRFISQSSPLGLRPKSRELALRGGRSFLKKTGCAKAANSTKCLQQLNVVQVLAATITSEQGWFETVLGNPLKWLPVNDEERGIYRILDKMNDPSPAALKRLSSMEIIIGVVQDEAALFVQLAEAFGFLPGGSLFLLRGKETVLEYLKDLLFGNKKLADEVMMKLENRKSTFAERQYVNSIMTIFQQDEKVATQVLLRYAPRKTIDENVDLIVEILTDYMFKCPSRYVAREMSNFTTVYLYETTQAAFWTIPKAQDANRTQILHSLDVPYFWNYFPTLRKKDQGLADLYTDYFSGFASGDINQHCTPNAIYDSRKVLLMQDEQQEPQCVKKAPIWRPFKQGSEEYIALGTPNGSATMMRDLRGDMCNFWDSPVDEFLRWDCEGFPCEQPQ